MIKVQIQNDKVTISGHSNFDDYGKDIVCASVSSIVYTVVNNINVIDSNAIQYKDDGNLMTIQVLNKDELVCKLFANLKELLYNLADDYPKNIKIESEE